MTSKYAASEKLHQFFTCNFKRTKKCVSSTFPFLHIMRNYDVGNDLINDIISGITVGIMQLPQGQ